MHLGGWILRVQVDQGLMEVGLSSCPGPQEAAERHEHRLGEGAPGRVKTTKVGSLEVKAVWNVSVSLPICMIDWMFC